MLRGTDAKKTMPLAGVPTFMRAIMTITVVYGQGHLDVEVHCMPGETHERMMQMRRCRLQQQPTEKLSLSHDCRAPCLASAVDHALLVLAPQYTINWHGLVFLLLHPDLLNSMLLFCK